MRLSAVAVVVISYSLLGFLHAQSQPKDTPPPRGAKHGADESAKGKPAGQADKPSSAGASVEDTSAAGHAKPQGAEIANAGEEKPQEQLVAVRSVPQLDVSKDWLDYTGVVLTVLVLVGAGWQLVLLRKTVRVTETAALAAQRSADGLQHAERAYVGLVPRQSDDEPAGDLGFYARPWKSEILPDGAERYKLEVWIVNSGNTPAFVEGGVIQYVDGLARHTAPDLLEPKVVNERGTVEGGYLFSKGRYLQKVIYHLSAGDHAAARAGHLWLIGFVTYRDVFGARHRAGFGRRVNAGYDGTKNNLSIDDASLRYNYDRTA